MSVGHISLVSQNVGLFLVHATVHANVVIHPPHIKFFMANTIAQALCSAQGRFENLQRECFGLFLTSRNGIAGEL